MKSTLQKNIKWFVGVVLLIALCHIMNTLFLQDWRARKSHERIEREIVKNYYENQGNFQELIEFASILPAINTIEFLGDDEFSCYLSNDSGKNINNYENAWIMDTWYNEESDKFEKSRFDINKDSTITLIYPDTTINVKYWSWEFRGGFENDEFDKFSKYSKYTKKQIKQLIGLVKNVDCRAIEITENKIHLIYRGNLLYHFEYLILKSQDKLEVPENYNKIDENIYCGLYDSGMFCRTMVFN